MKAKSKSEIAYACGMSVSTLKRWMRRHSEKFEQMGITPTQRLLPPKVVRFICEELGIHEDDFDW